MLLRQISIRVINEESCDTVTEDCSNGCWKLQLNYI